MPESYTPFTWADRVEGGTPITATQLNRIELGVESIQAVALAYVMQKAQYVFALVAVCLGIAILAYIAFFITSRI